MPRILITVPERTPQPYRFQLDRQAVTLGRGSENDVVVDCPSVSVKHAVMERVEGGYQLRDLGSTNGTKLDGRPQERITLRHGLSVRLGDVSFDFTLTDEERAALTREKPQEESPIIAESPTGDEIPLPRRAPAPAAQQTIVQPPGAAASFFMTLLFLVLAAFIFFVGMSIRYSKDHNGHSLIQAMKGAEPPAASSDTTETSTPETTPAATEE